MLLVTACDQQSAAEKDAQDARDVAQVEAVQKLHPPVQPLTLEPIDPSVRRIFNLTDAGCDFYPDTPKGEKPVLVTGRAKAVLRMNGEAVILAADSGTSELAPGTYAKYVGRTHWAELTREPASLKMHDRWDRGVYFARGRLTCRG